MSISLRRRDFWLLTFLPAIIAVFIIAMLMAIFLTPMAKENKVRLEEQFKQNRIQAVEEYERDRRDREGGITAVVHRTTAPRTTGSSSDPSKDR